MLDESSHLVSPRPMYPPFPEQIGKKHRCCRPAKLHVCWIWQKSAHAHVKEEETGEDRRSERLSAHCEHGFDEARYGKECNTYVSRVRAYETRHVGSPEALRYGRSHHLR